MKLSEYTSLEEKSKYFKDCVEINTILELKNFVNKLQEHKNDFLYRGVKEAKYKLYCSAQRKWITEDLKVNFDVSYGEYISNLLEQLKTIVASCSNGITMWQNDWGRLAFMQHYGAPSPFLDFTTNLDVAIYFGIANSNQDTGSTIDRYFSVYYIDILNNDKLDKMIDILTKVRIDVEKKIKGQVLPHISNNAGDYISYDLIQQNATNRVIWVDTNEIPLIIDEKGNSLDFNLYIQNPNIVAQKGELISVNNGEECLEELMYKHIHCININKSLIPHIKRYLKLNKIDHDTLFPNMYDIAKKCVDETYNSLTKKAMM